MQAASPILIPVLIIKSSKALSLIKNFNLKVDNVLVSIFKQNSNLLISLTESVFGNFFSCLNLNLSLKKGETETIFCSSRKE